MLVPVFVQTQIPADTFGWVFKQERNSRLNPGLAHQNGKGRAEQSWQQALCVWKCDLGAWFAFTQEDKHLLCWERWDSVVTAVVLVHFSLS